MPFKQVLLIFSFKGREHNKTTAFNGRLVASVDQLCAALPLALSLPLTLQGQGRVSTYQLSRGGRDY